MNNPIIKEMFTTIYKSIEDLKSRITDVKYGPIENNLNVILFKIDNKNYKGYLKGRNQDLVIGCGTASDAAIAARVFIDKDVELI